MSEKQKKSAKFLRDVADCKSLMKRKRICALGSAHEIACALSDHGFSSYVIAECTGMSDSSVRRATKAKKEGRDPGVNGHPSHLLKAEQEVLVEEVRDYREENGVDPSFSKVHTMVEHIVDERPGISHKEHPDKNWLSHYINRNPVLHSTTPRGVESVCVELVFV